MTDLMYELEVLQLVTRIIGRLEIFYLFLTTVSATSQIKGWTWTHLIGEATPLLIPLLVPHDIVQLAEQVETDVHAGNADENSVAPPIQWCIILTVDV